MLRTIILLAASCFVTTAAPAVTIEMVTVGNPGNAPDTEVMEADGTTGYGTVGYVYRIGKYEVTAGQYTEFLNAVAKEDPHGLYNPRMGEPAIDWGANIQRSGLSPNYIYSVAPDWTNRPVNYVSFWDAARFVNWLHNGQPTGPQGPGTTEDGAYINIGNQVTFGRAPGARFFIPSEDEWYKAAYHKNDGVTGNYWDYPTANDIAPINTLPDPGNHANFYDAEGTGNNGSTIGDPYQRTIVGEFANSPSPYGTFDQGGNVWEWTETPVYESDRIMRGGAFDTIDGADSLHASHRFSNPAWYDEYANFQGFRVAAAVPEPNSLLLATVCAFAWIGLLRIRRLLLRLVNLLAIAVAAGPSLSNVAAADTFGNGTNMFEIELVNIGDPGTAADTTGNPKAAGAVDYVYRMAKFEVSEQMIDGANAEGLLGIALLSRFGRDKPATSMSWNEAARFVNWLNTSSGYSPAYKFSTLPKEVGYLPNQNISLWVAGDPGFNAANPFRNSQAHYFLPSVDEWYKAAYYDPRANDGAAAYWNYPTGSHDVPVAVSSGTLPETVVYGQPLGNSAPADITSAGGLSPYGILALGGNVAERDESEFDLLNDFGGDSRGVRRSYWAGESHRLLASFPRSDGDPLGKNTFVGFRVAAAVPGPSSLPLAATCAFGFIAYCRRRQS